MAKIMIKMMTKMMMMMLKEDDRWNENDVKMVCKCKVDTA